MKIMKNSSALRTSQKIYTFFKRFGDIICSLLVFIFLGWLILLLMLLVKCTSKGTVFLDKSDWVKTKSLSRFTSLEQ